MSTPEPYTGPPPTIDPSSIANYGHGAPVGQPGTSGDGSPAPDQSYPAPGYPTQDYSTQGYSTQDYPDHGYSDQHVPPPTAYPGAYPGATYPAVPYPAAPYPVAPDPTAYPDPGHAVPQAGQAASGQGGPHGFQGPAGYPAPSPYPYVDPYGARYPGYPGYPPAYGYPPYAFSRPSAPGTVLGSAIIGYVGAAVLTLLAIILFTGASVFQDLSDAADQSSYGVVAELLADGFVNLVIAGLLIAGGVSMTAGKPGGRRLTVFGALLCAGCSIYWLARWGDGSYTATLTPALFFLILAGLVVALAFSASATRWLDPVQRSYDERFPPDRPGLPGPPPQPGSPPGWPY